MKKEKYRITINRGKILDACIMGTIIILQYLVLELSTGQAQIMLSIYNWRNIIVGLSTVFALSSVIIVLTCSYFTTAIISSSFITILSIINYYVIKYHGQPFTLSDISNAKSALAVIGGYSFSLKGVVLIEVLFLLIVIVFSFIYYRKKRITRIVTLPILMMAIIGFYIVYLKPNSYISRADISNNWVSSMQYVGYTPYFIHRSMLGSTAVRKPVGYDEEVNDVLQFMEKETTNDQQKEISEQTYPDIIFILNESYYDVDSVLQTDTHEEVFQNYDRLNGIKGFTITPQTGGGTNCSEYEYLTSNSTHLIPYASPFIYLDMKDSNTVISYLKSLGFYTIGMHQFDSTCYSRNAAYPAIGFDEILWAEDCDNLTYYGDRDDLATDESVYENLIKAYENGDEQSPRCVFCLTIQNHGQWEQNDSADDLVSIKQDFGEYTDIINEYLSCMKLSDNALGYITNYFENVDRDVIIVMTGDHCPGFLTELVSNAGDEEINLKLRSTPFLIWSNHLNLDTINNKENNLFSMQYLVPSALQVAHIPESKYYNYLLELKAKYPILEKENSYYDSEFHHHTFVDESELPDILRKYYYIEYTNILSPEEKSGFYY